MLEAIAGIINSLLIGMGVLAMRQLLISFHLFHPKRRADSAISAPLPSVTVCIPARNETHAMTECLERVLASTYPKLEIIVLDDRSVDDTSVLIKSFAHAGVRFVSGSALPKGWLGKNHALEGLLKEASGAYLFFLDVDTRLKPHTISELMQYTLREEATMVSVLPRREDGWRMSVLFSPLRYFWELLFHHTLAPAAASNAWVVKRKELQAYGGFASLKDAVKPEAHLAAYFAHTSRYRFMIGDEATGVSFEKKWRSQLMTSVRLLSPQLGGNWAALAIVVADLLLLFSPFFILTLFAGQLSVVAFWLSVVALMLFSVIYALYTHRVWRRGWLLAFFLWPLIVFQEIILMIASYIMYRRGVVTWKGRPVRSGVQS